MSDLKKIKNHLEAREIQPSEQFWDRLENELDQAFKPEKKSWWPWIGIAASVLLIVGIASVLFFNSGNDISEKSIAIQQAEELPVQNENQELINPTNENEAIISTTEIQNRTINSSAYESEKVKVNSVQNEKIQPINVKADSPEENISPETMIAAQDEQMNEIIQEMPLDSRTSDELLQQALAKRQINKENKIAVDSKRLLNDVEDELYEAKSPDILEKLTDRIKTLQVAFLNRNKE